MLVRELIARGEAARILVVAPAGLLENWRNELAGCFRLTFDVLGRDFRDHGAATWERYPRVIGSIDTLKQHRRMQRLLAAPPWDLVIFDEAHHLSRTRSGKKTTATRNYRLAEALRNHSRDLLFLSATPHQGNAFQFWSLIQLLDDQLFAGPEAVADHRGLLNHVMIRRTSARSRTRGATRSSGAARCIPNASRSGRGSGCSTSASATTCEKATTPRAWAWAMPRASPAPARPAGSAPSAS